MMDYSVVVPVFNEAENLYPLFDEIQAAMTRVGRPYEIIWIDDGSTDNSLEIIKKFSQQNPDSHCIAFARNRGQSAALSAGIARAKGKYVITMDSDRQNDPMDVINMAPLLEDYDMVTGWRKNRHDSAWKKFSSRFANAVRNRLSEETIKDTGCSLKIMKSEYLKRIKMFNGMHRFLPTLMKMEGASVIEIPVNHRPRIKGESKYGTWDRAFSGLADLLAVRWMKKKHIKYNIKEQF
jgi:dolichol-phosphate mannosyltransferase